jgi:hypothetical protein
MTLFSDGMAARLLVVNLIRELEKNGSLESAKVDHIFSEAKRQGQGWLEALKRENQAAEAAGAETDDLGFELHRDSIIGAISQIDTQLEEIQGLRE